MSLLLLVGVLSVVTGLLAWGLTGMARRYALQRLLDVPNSRSSHQIPTPRGGGLGIVLAFFTAILVLDRIVGVAPSVKWALLAALPVAAIGFWDDHGHVSARLRLIIHLAAGSCAVYLLGGMAHIALGPFAFELSWIGSGASVLWIVWCLNFFNFMDGIDGIAGTEAAFVTGAAGVLTGWLYPESLLAPVFILFASACLGFLVWNWPPARIFMGDVGSGFVGVVIGMFTVVSMNKGGLSLAVWLILLTSFATDATVTLFRRMWSGQRWYEAHRSHAYQHAALVFGSHKKVTGGVLLINLVWLFPLAIAAAKWPAYEWLITVAAYLPVILTVFRLGAGVHGWHESASTNRV